MFLHLFQPYKTLCLRTAGILLLAGLVLSGCTEEKPLSKFVPVPEKKQTDKKQEEDLLNRRVESVLNEGLQSKEGVEEAPRASKARAVPARKGCASRKRVPSPTAGNSDARRDGRKRTGPTPRAAKSRMNWSSTTSASAPTTRRERAVPGSAGISGTKAARQASSPSVKVVSIPLPE